MTARAASASAPTIAVPGNSLAVAPNPSMAGYTAPAPPSKKHAASITATLVMPAIICPPTGNSSMGVSVVISDAGSVFAASSGGGLADAICTNGSFSTGLQAYEGPTSVVSAPGLAVPGDTIQITVSQTRNKLGATVRDLTRGGRGVSTSGKLRKHKKPATVAVITQGGSGVLGMVASFGVVPISECRLDGLPLGGAALLRGFNLVNSVNQTEIATSPFAANNTSFTESFVRSH